VKALGKFICSLSLTRSRSTSQCLDLTYTFKQIEMKIKPLDVGIVSSVLLLSLIPATQAVPSWLQPHRREQDVKKTPRTYLAYEQAPKAEHYSYGGYGPAPTISSTSSPSVSITSQAGGELTSSSCKCSSDIVMV
jgi:hypothetical protein